MKPRFLLVSGVAALVAVAMTGCGGDGSPPQSTPSASPQPSLSATPLNPSTSPVPTGSVPPEVAGSPQVQAAVADLADRLDVSPSAIEVVHVSEVTWSDGSLGCPQPGVNYTQALVNGQLVVLAVDGQTYEYHSGPSRPLFYCADPKPPASVSGTGAGPA